MAAMVTSVFLYVKDVRKSLEFYNEVVEAEVLQVHAEDENAPYSLAILRVGDFILPIAAIRGEGTSNDYMPPEIPALPSFRLQRAVSTTIVKHGRDYWTGTVYTTNRRVWEHDEKFKAYLMEIRALGIDMETATLFIVGFVNHIPKGALLLVSDMPMTPEGVKTSRSDKAVTEKYVRAHLEIGIDSLIELRDSGEAVKHLRFE